MSRLFFYVNNLSSWLGIGKQMDEMEGNGKSLRITHTHTIEYIYLNMFQHITEIHIMLIYNCRCVVFSFIYLSCYFQIFGRSEWSNNVGKHQRLLLVWPLISESLHKKGTATLRFSLAEIHTLLVHFNDFFTHSNLGRIKAQMRTKVPSPKFLNIGSAWESGG